MAGIKPTIKNTVPVIAPDVKVIYTPPPIDSLVGMESGKATNAGSADGRVVDTKAEAGNGTLPAPTREPFVYVEQMPEYNGDMYAYLAKAVRYPQAAVQSGVQGRVMVNFVVDEQGHITRAVVKRGIGAGCDEEALRVINAMPAWKPGKQNGVPVKVYYTLPINFRIE